ncbi:MAG: MFS transporter [Candidatus Cloacimonadota bacterium]|nr:MAG: MFS transporter [Candidatus Cloacimonadota bacterium]
MRRDIRKLGFSKVSKKMKYQLTTEISRNNFAAFVWHGIFLSLASNFSDVHTIIPSMLIKAGGNAILLGLLTTIMIGGSGLMQIVFAGFISNKPNKKNSLLLGINLRIFALFLLGLLLIKSATINNLLLILFIFLLISVFSFSGSFAAVSYVDILGKSILPDKRKKFFSVKQTISSVGVFLSALLVRALLKYFQYPNNYGILFLIAAFFFFVSSLGFWKIVEIETFIRKKHTFPQYLKKIPKEISRNSNLKNYLIIINNLGLAFSFIPFMILFAKKNFGLTYGTVGNILLFKIAGMLIAGLVLYKRSENFEYKKLLYFSLVLGISLPILSLIFSGNLLIYEFIFLLSGVFITAYKIATNGILVEISDNENRATYTGISGAGNILPTVFPLVAGILIATLGYTFTFILISLIVASSFIAINNLRCYLPQPIRS